jgi:hypothetical protein
MKIALVPALLIALVGTVHAQSAVPITPGGKPDVSAKSTPTVPRSQYLADKAKVKADRKALKAAKAGGDASAISAAQATLKADSATLKADQDNTASHAAGEAIAR